MSHSLTPRTDSHPHFPKERAPTHPLKKFFGGFLAMLSDAELQFFVANGFVYLHPSVPAATHDAAYAKLEDLCADGTDPANGVCPGCPQLLDVLESAEVVGACGSLLGSNYMLHAHRRVHPSAPGRCDQFFHQDSYKGRAMLRYHRPMYLMGMYYPQDTPIQSGPTELLPGTQYYQVRSQLRNAKV
jgi:hypothetical protein